MTPSLFRFGRDGIVPRDYQLEAHDETLRLFQTSQGVLIRSATGTGKTLMASMLIDTWLRRSDRHRVMVVSYEQQLVWQFAEAIEQFTGRTPGIEMDRDRAGDALIVVASRQSLLTAAPPTASQLDELRAMGVEAIGAIPRRAAAAAIRQLRAGEEPRAVQEWLAALNRRPEAHEGRWSRLHQFDPSLDWLLVWDEAHRHAYHLASVQPIVDWFSRNPSYRQIGLTATPQRSDGVSLGDRMFPAIALDYPLYVPAGRCAVRDGYAVRYIQRFVQVEGVDFRAPHLLDASSDSGFDDERLARELETRLAGIVLPTLELVDRRRTLLFSPTVAMAIQVADFINARRRARCRQCGATAWQARRAIAAGEAVCRECDATIALDDILDGDTDAARELDGSAPPSTRKLIYRQFRENQFQFLSVCGLCREGFDDPGVAAIGCFRPVTRRAATLAEQMKGRACRLDADLARRLHEYPDAAARLAAIAASPKPDALIVDLVGITGLGDCASTVQIYAEGRPDEVIARAEAILAGGDTEDIAEAIVTAEEEIAEARARAEAERRAAEAQAREEAERRAQAQASARYSTHEIGFGDDDPDIATTKQYRHMAYLGMVVHTVISRGAAGRIITQLRRRQPLAEIAARNHLRDGDWSASAPSDKQVRLAKWKRVPIERAQTPHDVSLLIDARCQPEAARNRIAESIQRCRSLDDLAGPRGDLAVVRGVLPETLFAELVELGRRRRSELESPEVIPY